MFHSDDLTKLAGIVDGILTPEEKSKMGLLPSDDTALVNRVKSLVEDDMATSMTLEPLGRMVDKRTLYPWQGKESDSEIAFNFEDVMDAQRLYDFVVNTGLLESGEIRMHVSEHQVSVHFGSHVRVMKPEVLQAALLAYYDYVEDIPGNDEAFESLVQELDDILTEKTKVSGAPKKRAKGNPFHDKKDGKFSGPDGIAADKGGSFSSKKTKLKFAGEKKSKAGDSIVHFASTKRPCGRKARRTGKDIRCWDGEKGKGFPESVQAGIDLSGIIRKQILGEEITDDDLRGMVRAIDYVIDAAAMIESRLREDVELEEATVTYKRSYPPKIDDAMKKWREGGMWDNLPKIYIDYHKKFASEELKKLARKYKLKVLSSRMIPSGDLDGMMLLQAKVELPGGKNITIKWLDSHGNGQWMKDTGHGHAILFVSDLQEDVELEEGKKYYVLAGKSSKDASWEVVFGDYDKETVKDEKDSESRNWKKLKVVSLGTDKQSAIDAAIKKLNEDVELDEARMIKMVTFPGKKERDAFVKQMKRLGYDKRTVNVYSRDSVTVEIPHVAGADLGNIKSLMVRLKGEMGDKNMVAGQHEDVELEEGMSEEEEDWRVKDAPLLIVSGGKAKGIVDAVVGKDRDGKGKKVKIPVDVVLDKKDLGEISEELGRDLFKEKFKAHFGIEMIYGVPGRNVKFYGDAELYIKGAPRGFLGAPIAIPYDGVARLPKMRFEDVELDGSELIEEYKVGPNCKKVIGAFLDKKAMEGGKLTTDGKRLDGNWSGGRGIAQWDKGKIRFNDLGSKAAQTVERSVKKAAPKNWLAEGETRPFDLGTELSEGKKMTRKQAYQALKSGKDLSTGMLDALGISMDSFLKFAQMSDKQTASITQKYIKVLEKKYGYGKQDEDVELSEGGFSFVREIKRAMDDDGKLVKPGKKTGYIDIKLGPYMYSVKSKDKDEFLKNMKIFFEIPAKLTRREYERLAKKIGVKAVEDSEMGGYGDKYGSYGISPDKLSSAKFTIGARLRQVRYFTLKNEKKGNKSASNKSRAGGVAKKTGQLWEPCQNCGREPSYMPLGLCDKCWPGGNTEDVELDEGRLSKKDLEQPWMITGSQWMTIKGIHEPWIAEISPMQYSRMSERAKKAYDKKREAEWQTSYDAKQAWAKAVIDAYNDGKFDLNDKDVNPKAKSVVIQGQIAAEKRKKEELFNKALVDNRIKDASQLKVGDRVFSVMGSHYGEVVKVSKKSVQVKHKNGKVYKEFAKALQWLSYNDLKKSVLGEDVELLKDMIPESVEESRINWSDFGVPRGVISEVVNREAVLIYPVDLQRFHQFSTGPKDASNWQAKTYVITGKPKSRGKMTSVPVKSLTGKKDVIDLPSKEKIKAYTRMNLEKVFKTKEVDPLTLKPGDKVIRSAQWGDSVVRISKKSESVPNVLGKDGMAVQTYGVFIIGHPSQVGKSADRTYLRRENVLRIVGEIKEDVELEEAKRPEEVYLSMSDEINQNVMNKTHRIKIDSSIYDWFVKRFSGKGSYTATDKAKALSDQNIVINKKDKKVGSREIVARPFGSYLIVKDDKGGSGKKSIRYFRFQGKIAEDVELDEGKKILYAVARKTFPDEHKQGWVVFATYPSEEAAAKRRDTIMKKMTRSDALKSPVEIVRFKSKKRGFLSDEEYRSALAEDVELDEGDVYNVLGRETVKGSGEAQKLAARIRKEIEKSMPPGAVLKCDVEKSFGKKLISIATALEKDINKVPNQIRQNDRAYQTFFVYGVNEDDSLQDKMEATIAQGGTLLVKPEPGSHMAFGSVKFGWRKKKGTPEQIVKHFGNYFKKVKKVIQDNKGMIPESVEESRINWSDFGVPQGVISEMVKKPGPAKMHS